MRNPFSKREADEPDDFIDDLDDSFETWLEEQSQARVEVAHARAMRESPYDDLGEALACDYDGTMEKIFWELHVMQITDSYESLARRGYVKKSVDPSGEIAYELTDQGRLVVELQGL